VFIIAEIGTSHDGKLGLAIKLIEEAEKCGVNAVKLQTVSVDESYMPGEKSYEIFKNLWFEYEDLEKLMKVAEANHIILFSTPGDLYSLELMLKVKMPMAKISSGLLTNQTLIKKIAKSKLPIMISTGMSYLDEVGSAIRVAENNGCQNIMLMHSTSLYPAPSETLNLNSIKTMNYVFPYPVGYSDHSVGMTAAIAACTLGACLIEKHFILDSSIPGPDNVFAVEPKEMRSFVEEIRNVEKMFGTYVKQPTEEEKAQRNLFRRCLVARTTIKSGQTVNEEMIAIKRPRIGEYGLPPSFLEYIIGLGTNRDVAKNEVLSLDMFCIKS
jgi:sialic acid synthase SpsE